MYFILYYAFSTYPFTDEQLADLLEKSRIKNAVAGITGKLLYCEGTFIQLVEGEKSKVDQLYSLIERDKRLIAIKKIKADTHNSRYFPEWSMGYGKITFNDIKQFEDINHTDIEQFLENSSAFKLMKLLAVK